MLFHTHRTRIQLGCIFIFATIITCQVHAATPRSIEGSTGITAHRIGQTTNSDSGSASSVGASSGHVAVQYHHPFRSVLLSPYLRYSPESLGASKSRGSTAKTSTLTLALPVTFYFGAAWDFGLGPNISRRTVRGTGGSTQTLPNAGTEEDFFTPSKSVTSTTSGIQFVIGWQRDSIRGTLDILIDAPLSQTRKATSIALSGAYVWK